MAHEKIQRGSSEITKIGTLSTDMGPNDGFWGMQKIQAAAIQILPITPINEYIRSDLGPGSIWTEPNLDSRVLYPWVHG